MLKILHVAVALISIGGYLARGILMLRESPLLQAHWVRIAPHVVDTLLLLARVGLAFKIHQYPFVEPWLTAKVLALIAYVIVGAIGLRYGRTKGIRYYRLDQRHSNFCLHRRRRAHAQPHARLALTFR